MIYKDFIIPLAWPEAPVRTAGGPYDKILELFKLYRNGYYKAGHAAFLLINHTNGDIDYYDFGRYISPDKNGRARSKETDPEILFNVKAHIEDGKITNLFEIIKAIGAHPQTHGEGTLYAGIQDKINRDKAIEYVKSIQAAPYTPYGPFVVGGTNCSRFVAQTIAKSIKGNGFKFIYPWYFTPAPLGNIFYSSGKTLFKLSDSGRIEELLIKGVKKQFNFMKEIMLYKNGETTPDPSKASLNKIDEPQEKINAGPKAQWLGGTGAGAWYELKSYSENGIEVARIQANGDQDFCFEFIGSTKAINFNHIYKFEHGSHGLKIILSQNGQIFEFIKK
ncbi:MAG: hypothetical protein CMP67_09825 [Flavobacteriales bacterium]|nr:hypothetical protein [Flavobacteriales bacterium]|tara:strand:+ start:1573 stop:2574 length:1002 start_codon:yes stop_codon:yes gene_type:complete